MFFAIRRALTARMQARAARRAQELRVLAALVRQAQAAATVRQLALVQALGQPWLPARARAVLALAVQAQLVRLQAGPVASSSRRSPRSSSSRTRRARSTTRRRR